MNISELLNCSDRALIEKIERAIAYFCELPTEGKYHLAFSGGKDSHAILAIYLLYLKLGNKQLNIKVIFADTLLETPVLYDCIDKAFDWCKINGIVAEKVLPVNSYWYYQFAIGYPVPDHFNRWCTKFLKVDPLLNQSHKISITGRHFGESQARDKRLTCGSSGECGVDKIKKSHDPIINFTNSDVWDLLFYADGTVLYEGVFNQLQSTYNANTDTNGSLRMGCFMCPVVSKNTIKSNRLEYYPIRLTLEKLRECRRIRSPRTKKNGAIYIEDRREVWQQLDKQFLLDNGFISETDIELIDNAIASDYSYPKTYTKDWIDSEHKRLHTLPLQMTLF